MAILPNSSVALAKLKNNPEMLAEVGGIIYENVYTDQPGGDDKVVADFVKWGRNRLPKLMDKPYDSPEVGDAISKSSTTVLTIYRRILLSTQLSQMARASDPAHAMDTRYGSQRAAAVYP